MRAGDDDDDCAAFWCFEEKGGVGELWAGVAAAEVRLALLLLLFSTLLLCSTALFYSAALLCSSIFYFAALLCEICSALHPMRAPPPFILLAPETREQIWKQIPEKYLEGEERALGDDEGREG